MDLALLISVYKGKWNFEKFHRSTNLIWSIFICKKLLKWSRFIFDIWISSALLLTVERVEILRGSPISLIHPGLILSQAEHNYMACCIVNAHRCFSPRRCSAAYHECYCASWLLWDTLDRFITWHICDDGFQIGDDQKFAANLGRYWLVSLLFCTCKDNATTHYFCQVMENDASI